MQKKTRYKSRSRDVVVVLFCLVVAGFFLHLFWQDLNAFTTRNDKPKIGTISFKERVAQRKYDDRVVWERVAQNAELYYGDTIRTADFAQATITFADGTTLDLYENTMVQVFWTEDDGLQIDVDGGDIQVDASASTAENAVSVKLADGLQVAMDAGSSLAVKADAAGASNVEVKSGSAQVTTESGEAASLSLGESVSVQGGGEIRKNPLTVIAPKKELKLFDVRGEAIPVTMEWRAGDDEAVTVQTSRAKDFAVLETDRLVRGATSTELLADGGTFYWRVFTDATRDSPVAGRVSVEPIARVQNIAPAAATHFRYRTSLPRVGFRWTGNDYADHYRLLISTTPDMQQAVVDRNVGGTFATVDTLEQGTYWWQVTPYYAVNNIGYAAASDVAQFAVFRDDQIRPPELSAPADGAQLVSRDVVPVTFMWRSDLADADYTVQVARDANFSDIVWQTQTTETRFSRDFTAQELPDGGYYWKIVRNAPDDDDVTPVSAIRRFTVATYVPQDNKLLYPPENFSTEQAKLAGTAFMWKLSDDYADGAAQSVLQFSASSDFASVRVERTSDATVIDNVTLPQGTWWWRVGAKSADGELHGLTPPRMLTVLAELRAPEFISPRMNQELISYNNAPVTLSWSAVGGADYYAVRVLNSDDDIVAQDLSVAGERVSFVLPEDRYTVRVQSVADAAGDAAPRLSSVTTVGFSVRAPRSVQQIAPADGSHIAGLTALRTPTVFSWGSQERGVGNYRFELWRQQDNGAARLVETVSGNRTSASFNRLTAGTYLWKVSASTADGIPLDSAERRVIVDAIPLLPAPALTEPAQNLVMDGAYLRAHRTITCRWLAVAGATAYTFTLSKRNANGSLTVILTERNTSRTSVTIRDLSVLDVGDFVWTVTAASYARDGYEEQRGRTATGAFKIDFAAPTRVDTVRPGKMYGERR